MKTRTALFLLGLVGLAGLAIYYYERQIARLQELTYQLISINVAQATEQLATLNLIIRISSKSTLDATVMGMYIDVYVNGVKLSSINSQQGFVIPAMGYSDAPIQVNISPELLAGNLVSLLTGIVASQTIPINLVGYVRIKEAFINISVPFDYSTTVASILS